MIAGSDAWVLPTVFAAHLAMLGCANPGGSGNLRDDPVVLLHRARVLLEERQLTNTSMIEQAFEVKVGEAIPHGTGRRRSRLLGWLEMPGELADYAYDVLSRPATAPHPPALQRLEIVGLSLFLGAAPCVRPETVQAAFCGPPWSVSTRYVHISHPPPGWTPLPLVVVEAADGNRIDVRFADGLARCATSARMVQTLGPSPGR
jgi:hypothetical protein